MKKLLFIIKLLKSHNIVDLIFDEFLLINEKIYKKFDDVPVTGEMKIPNGKDKCWMITNNQNGLPHGLYRRFLLDGSLMEKGLYISGLRLGKWNGYNPNGSINYTLTKTY